MLTALSVGDADDFEEALQECENMEVQEANASMGSKTFRQRLTSNAAQTPAKSAWSVREIHVERESSGSEADYGRSDNDSYRSNV